MPERKLRDYTEAELDYLIEEFRTLRDDIKGMLRVFQSLLGKVETYFPYIKYLDQKIYDLEKEFLVGLRTEELKDEGKS